MSQRISRPLVHLPAPVTFNLSQLGAGQRYFPLLNFGRPHKIKLHASISLRRKQIVLRRRRRRVAREKIRHAALRLFAAHADGSFPEARSRARAAGPPDLLRDEGEFKPGRAAHAGQSRRRLRHRQRRRIAARHRGGRRPAQMRFRRRRQDGAEIEFALRQGIYSFNVESEPELAAHQPRRRAPEEKSRPSPCA